MYLSRVKLNVNKRQTQIALVSLNKLHGAIENSFVQSNEITNRRRKLWRIDRYNGCTYLFVLSSDKPDFKELINQYGFSNEESEVKEYDKLLNKLEKGSVWRFRLVANPTKSLSQEGKRGKVVAHITPEHQMEWLIKQSNKNGFELIDNTSQIVNSGWLIFDKRNERKIRILSVAYEGCLKINDVDLFKDALINGIGREKAYGMGLLTIMMV